jgi:hypothetical protein
MVAATAACVWCQLVQSGQLALRDSCGKFTCEDSTWDSKTSCVLLCSDMRTRDVKTLRELVSVRVVSEMSLVSAAVTEKINAVQLRAISEL